MSIYTDMFHASGSYSTMTTGCQIEEGLEELQRQVKALREHVDHV